MILFPFLLFFLTFLHPHGQAQTSPATHIICNVRDYGAKGDGVTNDTAAFQKAAAAIDAAGGGTVLIPQGTYLVGQQTFAGAAGRGYAYRAKEILHIDHCKYPVVIKGTKAVLKAAGDLKLGSFDPVTGKPFQPAKMPFTDSNYRADAYWGMIHLTDNKEVRVSGLELDGSLSQLTLGGQWGDTGRQCAADGIAAYGNEKLTLENITTHHHGLDGVIVGNTGMKPSDAPRPTVLNHVVSEYNARQGLSWVGGIGLQAMDCKFNHTGRVRFSSAPGSGLDVEAEDSICRKGVFTRCEFIDNVGFGMVADSGDSRDLSFQKCRFWGTINFSIWPRKPGIVFNDCDIYGSAVNAYGSKDADEATKFLHCRFEDKEYPKVGVYRSNAVIEMGGENLLFDDCTIIGNATRAVWLDNNTVKKTLRNTTVIHRDATRPEGDFQSLLRGCILENVRFEEDFSTGAPKNWYIAVENAEVRAGTVVNGPHVKWGHWTSGRVGTIEKTP